MKDKVFEYDTIDKRTLELIQKAQKGDSEAQNIMVQENIGLVWSIVKRFKGREAETEDLFQIGCIGLIKAVKKFDPDFDVRFQHMLFQ